MPFVKGQSGNPNGRPKKTPEQIAFEIECRGYASTSGIKKLKAWADSDNAPASLKAIEIMNGYGFGKPVETQVLDATVTADPSISPDELAAKIAALGGEGKTGSGAAPGPVGVESGK